MFFDLNVPVPSRLPASKKGKEKQAPPTFSAAEIETLEAKVDLLVHLGYTVIAFTQTVHKRVDSKTHSNTLNVILQRLKPRPGVVFLKRLTIILDEDSEKGFGLINANVSLFNGYDLIALVPTTHATLSLACLTHTLPSPLTAHIISLPLTLPRLPYHLKHTLIRTALKNSAVFEINYVGALGGDNDPLMVDADAAENGASAKRNWWASAREVVRVTKGKGLLVSSGVVSEADFRAPRDVGNLITILGLPQDAAHDASTRVPKSLVIRAETRKTYRAALSEPTLVVPPAVSAQLESAMDVSDSPPTLPTESLKRPLDATAPPETTNSGDRSKKKKKKEKGTKN
ncbi:PHP domain-like protein [Ephemerocybe angulata]|uniref:PHP domain-like protein n=1 Tax=Ephemerocybe angulata TaxID=980116 RepID=A0A8H6HAI5_9AGAR|nr:PHP domain-like protein [Tulosesus angulatus]